MNKKKNKSTREKRRRMTNENKIEEDNILGKKVEREKESKLKSKSNIIRILIEPIINKERNNKKVKNNEEKKGKIMNINKEKKERKKVDNTKKIKALTYRQSQLNKNYKTLKQHKDGINYLLQLKDGRLASCSWDKSLNIYDNNLFKLELSIKDNSDIISSFTELNDGRIIICLKDNKMKIIKLIKDDIYHIEQIIEEHKFDVLKVIEIKNNELISISKDNTMKIWLLNKDNLFESVTTIFYQNLSISSNILKINEKEFVTSSVGDKNLKFWNSYNYSNFVTLNNIDTDFGFNNLCILNDNILCVGGSYSKGCYLINLLTHQIIKNILAPKQIISVIKCLDGLLLCSILDEKNYYSIVKYKFENFNFVEVFQKENAHDRLINCCIELNNGIVASGGYDSLIKLWV